MHRPSRPAFAWFAVVLGILAAALAAQQPAKPAAIASKGGAPFSHSLLLVDGGSYLDLPPDVFSDLTETTIEAWVKWNAFGNRYQRIFNYGTGNRDIGLTTE